MKQIFSMRKNTKKIIVFRQHNENEKTLFIIFNFNINSSIGIKTNRLFELVEIMKLKS